MKIMQFSRITVDFDAVGAVYLARNEGLKIGDNDPVDTYELTIKSKRGETLVAVNWPDEDVALDIYNEIVNSWQENSK